MKRISRRKATKTEEAIIRDIAKVSAFELVDRGRARILTPRECPAPIKRFLRRERLMVHIKLTPAIKRKLDARSKRIGISVDALARKWIEQALIRDAG
jgi:hypothetical protein